MGCACAASRVRARKGRGALVLGLDLHPANDAKDKYTPEAEPVSWRHLIRYVLTERV